MKKIFLGIFVVVALLTSCATAPKGSNLLLGQWIMDLPDGSSNMWEFINKDWKLTQSNNNRIMFSQTKPYAVKGNEIIIKFGMGINMVYNFESVSPNVLIVTLNWDKYPAMSKKMLKQQGYTDEMFAEMRRPLELSRFDDKFQVSEFTHLERADDVETAFKNAAKRLIDSLDKGKTIAISNISTEDADQSTFLASELEIILIEARIALVDRSQLDIIRQEQHLQLSGDVDDNQIVSIGKFAGASYIITGSIDGTGGTRRLRLRLLDIETARVITAAAEKF